MIDSPAKPVPSASRPPVAHSGSKLASADVHQPLSTPDSEGALHYRMTVEEQITPNDYPRLTSLVRRLAPDTGSVRPLGDGLLWEHDSGYSALALTINSEPTGTVIRADFRFDGRLSALYLGSGLSSIVTGLVSGGALGTWIGVGIGVASIVPFGMVAKSIWRRSGQASMRNIQRLVDQLAAAIRGELD